MGHVCISRSHICLTMRARPRHVPSNAIFCAIPHLSRGIQFRAAPQPSDTSVRCKQRPSARLGGWQQHCPFGSIPVLCYHYHPCALRPSVGTASSFQQLHSCPRLQLLTTEGVTIATVCGLVQCLSDRRSQVLVGRLISSCGVAVRSPPLSARAVPGVAKARRCRLAVKWRGARLPVPHQVRLMPAASVGMRSSIQNNSVTRSLVSCPAHSPFPQQRLQSGASLAKEAR